MEGKSIAFNEGQFKRLGMDEAFTPKLLEQMQERPPFINHSFAKDYEGDKVEALISLKKSTTSDNFFINKFDLSLQKEGSKESIKQTFYVDNKAKANPELENGQKEKPDTKFTLKKAYNFLAGRPVYHKESQSWEQINLGDKLANGNYATQRFDKNYGFDLAKVVDQYSLANPQYKNSLMESFQRGNLQKEKLVDKNGKIEEYYLSTSVKSGALNMYDLNKKPVPLETQIDRELISKELGEKLKELFQNKHTPEQSQTSEIKQIQQVEKPKKSQKQTTEKPEKKQSKNQKVRR